MSTKELEWVTGDLLDFVVVVFFVAVVYYNINAKFSVSTIYTVEGFTTVVYGANEENISYIFWIIWSS